MESVLDEDVEVNPYANIALAQKEKVMEHIQRRHEAFLTVTALLRLLPSISGLRNHPFNRDRQ